MRDAAGFVSFHAVCKQWRGSRDLLSRRARTTRTQFLPWLLATPEQEPGHLKFRCVFSKASYCVVSPSPVPRGNWVCSTDGAGVWYLAVDEHFHPSLHDPLTGAVAHLPTFPWEEEFDPCSVIYQDGTTFLYSIGYLIVGGNYSEWFRAALLRPGDAEWTAVQRTIQAPDHGEFCAMYHSGKIMVAVEAGQWHIVTPDGGDDVLVPRPPHLRWGKGPYSRQYSHVLESRGELLWVVVEVQFCRYTCTTGIRPGLSVVVHALGEVTTSPEKTRWVRKHGHSLTDRVLFLGWSNSFAMDASRLDGRDGGCVYFVYCGNKALPREEVGVFSYNLVHDNIKDWYFSRQNNLESIERLPQGLHNWRCTWLVPQPAIAPILLELPRGRKPSDSS
ncbi:hypothetical protein VPH35_085178 [Triticum aestivum]